MTKAPPPSLQPQPCASWLTPQVQLGSEVAMVQQGRLAAVGQAPQLAPKLVAVRPEVMVAQTTGHREDSDQGPGSIRLWGYNLCCTTRPGQHDVIICRQAGG